MSMEHLNATKSSKKINAHSCCNNEGDEDNFDDRVEIDVDDDDDTDIDDNTSIRTATFNSTTRRLTNAMVREIFEYLYHSGVTNHHPTNNNATKPQVPIPFTIVPVNSNGKALSPPSYEFECKLLVSLCVFAMI